MGTCELRTINLLLSSATYLRACQKNDAIEGPPHFAYTPQFIAMRGMPSVLD